MSTVTVRARLGGVVPFGPELHHLLPDEVREASERFAAALADLRDAQRATKDAEAEVRHAASVDARAAERAALDGEPLPKATAPAAEAALTDAHRELEARRGAAEVRQREMLAATLARHADLRTAALEALDDKKAAALAALDDFEAALTGATALRQLITELGEDGRHLGGRSVVFHPSPPARHADRDRLAGAMREQLDAARALVTEEP